MTYIFKIMLLLEHAALSYVSLKELILLQLKKRFSLFNIF